MTFKIGDRVRLLAWNGLLEGFEFMPEMQSLVGTEIEIEEFDCEGVVLAGSFGWPFDALAPAVEQLSQDERDNLQREIKRLTDENKELRFQRDAFLDAKADLQKLINPNEPVDLYPAVKTLIDERDAFAKQASAWEIQCQDLRDRLINGDRG